MASIAFGQNDPRARHLAAALSDLGHDVVEVDFDNIDPLTKGLAAISTINSPRSEWWESFQNHPLVQRRRSKVFSSELHKRGIEVDGIVTWGSWFCPKLMRKDGSRIQHVYYIDQSRSIVPEPGESKGLLPRPRSGNVVQGRGYEKSERVLCMSHWAVAQSRRAHPGVSPGKFEWAGWGPCAFDASSEQIQPTSGAKKVLLVANDFYRKGVDWFVETAALVRSVTADVEFVLIGRDQSNFRVDLGEHISYLGPIYDKVLLKRHFQEASIFFLPNRFDRSPHVLTEALSAGLPIVVSNQGGAAELIDEGKVGRKVGVGSVEGYAQAIIQLLRDEREVYEIQMRAKALVRESYNWHAVARRIVRALRLDSEAS